MHIMMTNEQRAKLRASLTAPNAAWNEILWNLALADVAARYASGVETLFGQQALGTPVWIEAKPESPRECEGHTCVDLAAGAIRFRDRTSGGIEHDPDAAVSWVGFVEAKVLSDCSISVTHDPIRNQLARVLENLLTFQGGDQLPEQLCFALVTPRFFLEPRRAQTRLYGYKYDVYAKSKQAIADDIDLSCLPQRQGSRWTYPHLTERLERLHLRWVAYEEVLSLDSSLGEVDVMASAISGELPPCVRSTIESALAR